MSQAERSVIHFPKQSKPTRKKHPKEKCTVLEWIRKRLYVPGEARAICATEA